MKNPVGQTVARTDHLNGEFGSEDVSALARGAGTYRIEIETKPGAQAQGGYRIQLTALRNSEEVDRQRLRAEELMRGAEADERAQSKERR